MVRGFQHLLRIGLSHCNERYPSNNFFCKWLLPSVIILGGVVSLWNSWGNNHEKSRPALSLQYLISHSNVIEVDKIEGDIGTPVMNVGHGKSNQLDTDYLNILAKSNPVPRKTSLEPPDFEFNFIGNACHPDLACPSYLYVSKTGELGDRSTWYLVPAEFKAWMLKIKAKLPKQKQYQAIHLHGATIIVPK